MVGFVAMSAEALPPKSGAEPVPSYNPATRAVQSQLPVPGEFSAPRRPTAPPPPIYGAPSLISTIEGFEFYDNWLQCRGIFIPPDPIGASGPDHVVAVGNVMIEWYDKTGGSPTRMCLDTFFASLIPTSFPFDPKVIYDQHAGRFVVIALIYEDLGYGSPADVSQILVAVSKTSNPNGGWWFHAINSKKTFYNYNIGATTAHWADYPGLAVDDEAVYITANMFSFAATGQWFGDAWLWIVHKGLVGGLYDGGAAVVTSHDPTGAGGTDFTLQPAHVFGANPPGNGTFLVSAWWSDDYGLGNGTGDEYVHFIRIDDPVGTPSFTPGFVDVGNIENQLSTMYDSPQATCSQIDPKEAPIVDIASNDRRMLHAVWRDNTLWATATIWPQTGADTDQATVHWWKIDTQTIASPSLADQGSVGGEDIATGVCTFFSSIAVDGCGNMALGFSASGPTIFAGAYFTGRLASDPVGYTQPPGVLAAGLDCYRRTFCSGENRWGDYSGISVDPTDDATFWVFNEYAIERNHPTSCISPPDTLLEFGQWGTRWGSFRLNNPPVALCQNLQVIGDSTVVCVNNSVGAADVDNGSYDPDGDSLSYALVPPGPYTLGFNHVDLIVTDPCGASDTCTAIIAVECPVPVKLADLIVTREARGAVLRWRVTEAVDHLGFQVYRQIPGSTREQISRQLLTGREEYEFVDASPPSGSADYWLREISRTGISSWHGPVTLAAGEIVQRAVLSLAEPNPFDQATTIAYRIPSDQHVRVSVYDVGGHLVKTLVNEFQGTGSHATTWDGTTDGGGRAAIGQYLIRLNTETDGRTQKVLFVR